MKTTFLASCVVILVLAETGAVCAQAPPQTDGQNSGQVSSATTDPLVGTRAGEERDDNSLKLKLVWCPAGTFTMGSPKSEKGREDDKDQVQVTLTRGFWIGKYEVTQDEWARVMGTAPWKDQAYLHEGPRSPACYITWDDARAFVRKFTEQERRAGKKTTFSFGDTETQLSDYAWWGGVIGNGSTEKERYSHEVGGKKPNVWGLHDLHGNVDEWCADGYADKLPGSRDPLIVQASHRGVRGGGWEDSPSDCRWASRGGFTPGGRGYDLGFRVARSPVR